MINLLIALSHQSAPNRDLVRESVDAPESTAEDKAETTAETMDFAAFLEQPVLPLVEGQATPGKADLPAVDKETLIEPDRKTGEHLPQDDPTSQVDVVVSKHDSDHTGGVVAPIDTDVPYSIPTQIANRTDSPENKQAEHQPAAQPRGDGVLIKGASIVELKLQSTTGETSAQTGTGAGTRTDAEQIKPLPIKVVQSSASIPVSGMPGVRTQPLSSTLPAETMQAVRGTGETLDADAPLVSRILPVRLVDSSAEPAVTGRVNLPVVPIPPDATGHVLDAPVVAPMFAAEGETLPLQQVARVSAPQPAAPPSVSEQIVAVILQKSDSVTELVLAPKELGRIQMVVNSIETGLVLHITSERPETLDLVRRHIAELAQDLKAVGYQDVKFEFSGERSMSGRNEAFVPQALELEAQTEEQYSGVFDAPVGLPRIGAIAGLDMRV